MEKCRRNGGGKEVFNGEGKTWVWLKTQPDSPVEGKAAFWNLLWRNVENLLPSLVAL